MAEAIDRIDEEQDVSIRRKRMKIGSTKMQAPLVPMIDVTFLLLLYFLLTAEFRGPEGQIAGTIPKGESAAGVVTVKPIRIQIVPGEFPGEASFVYVVRGTRVEPVDGDRGDDGAHARGLYLRLVAYRQKEGEDVPIVIEPLHNVPWRYVTEAFNQAIRVKFKKVGFAPSKYAL